MTAAQGTGLTGEEVNTLERECMRTLHVVGTGQIVPPGVAYVGTGLYAAGAFVFHVYAEAEATS